LKHLEKPTRKRNAKRDLFSELSEGMDALAAARYGRRTLPTHSIEFKSWRPLQHHQNLIRIRKAIKP
jgi:hypothetical protein